MMMMMAMAMTRRAMMAAAVCPRGRIGSMAASAASAATATSVRGLAHHSSHSGNRADWEWKWASTPIESASTPPKSWYLSHDFWRRVECGVTFRNWVVVGRKETVMEDGATLAGEVLGEPFVIVNTEGELAAFSNVCRHHGAQLCDVGQGHVGRSQRLTCPYHGWQYSTRDGRLAKATHMKGCKEFTARDIRLKRFALDTVGPWLFLHLGESPTGTVLGDQPDMVEFHQMLAQTGYHTDLVHVHSRSYHLKCNWKVFIDNYLDGGYHVPVAHPGLTQSLDLGSYRRQAYQHFFLQACGGTKVDESHVKKESPSHRITGGKQDAEALYLYHYPNLCVNRYGDWMDTNIVWPIGPHECVVLFDWFIHKDRAHEKDMIEASIRDSDQVQQEDIWLCDRVQKGLNSLAYEAGRYSPELEGGEYLFHQLLHADMIKALAPRP